VYKRQASARVPLPRQMSVMPAGDTAERDSFVFTKDWHWVTLAAVISRRAQREVYEKAGYDAAALNLLVADIEAEREQRHPDGQWGSSEIVQPYLVERFVGPRKLRLFKQGTGYAVRQSDWTYLQKYRSELSSPEVQARILRAPFQSLLVDQRSSRDYRVEWTVPKTLGAPGGIELDLADAEYGLYFLPEDSASRGNTVPWSSLRESLAKGWRGGRLEQYLDAFAALRSIEADLEMPLGQRRLAERLLNQYERDIELAEEMDQIIRSRTESAVNEDRLGRDVEPIWATDTTVEPGKTYRYRVRLLAFNSYAGMTSRLADPLDASQIILEGEWSPWSEPLTVRPTSYLFVLGGSGEGKKTVRVRVYQWIRGVWENGYATFGIGDRVVIDKGLIQLTYDGVIRDIDLHRSYAQDGERGPDAGRGASSETVALTLVDSEGVTEERLAAEDWTLMNNLVRQIREEERRQKIAPERGQVGRVTTELPAYGRDSESRMPADSSGRGRSRKF